MRRLSAGSLACVALIAASVPAAAQVGETQISLVVSPTYVDFVGFGGGFSAAAAQLRISRYFTVTTGAELSTFAVLPLGQARSEPGCAPGNAPCQARQTPSMIQGGLLSALGVFGETGFRGSLGGGVANVMGMEGPGARTSAVGSFGLEWVPSGKSRFTPTFSVRMLQLASPLAGMRQLFLPGLGLTF
jgi:hypothetical protein